MVVLAGGMHDDDLTIFKTVWEEMTESAPALGERGGA